MRRWMGICLDVIDIAIESIEYESNWSWLSRHLKLTKATIDGVVVTTQSPSESSPESQPFTGIELPLTIDIKQLLVNQLSLVADTVSGARDLLAIWVTDSLNLTAQGETYVDEIVSILVALVNSTAQTIADMLS